MATIIEQPIKTGTTPKKQAFSYYVVFRDEEGKQVWKHAGHNKAAAKRLKTKIESELDETGRYSPPKPVSFKELAEEWLAIKEREVRPKSFASYKPHVKRLTQEFGSRKVRNIEEKDLEAFKGRLIESGIGPATIGRCLTLAGSIFRLGIRRNYTSSNPVEFVKKPKVPGSDIDFLEPEEVKALIAATPDHHRTLIMFAIFTGARQSEILGLKWDNVDLNGRRVYIREILQGNRFMPPKTESSRRVIDMPQILVKELAAHQTWQKVYGPPNPHNLVFTSATGSPLISRNVTQRWLEPALQMAGLRKVSFHSLRHTYASMLIAQGETVKTVQTLLGHASGMMTLNIYSHLFEGQTQKAAARLGDAFQDCARPNTSPNTSTPSTVEHSET